MACKQKEPNCVLAPIFFLGFEEWDWTAVNCN